MDEITTKRLYKEAVRKWGLPLQFGMLMEECAELIKATNKVMRKGEQSAQVWRDLAEEMADVEIMIGQIKTFCDWERLQEKVKTAKHDKLLRLKSMLEEKEMQEVKPNSSHD